MAPSDLAGPPTGTVVVPDVVRRLARGVPPVPVWENAAGGLTFRLDPARPGGAVRYAKWAPLAALDELDLSAEAARLAWARPFTPVPRVLDAGADAEGAWLVTEAVPGRSAVDARWLADPRTAVRAIGAGLRALHDVLPAAGCPFDWGVVTRLDRAEARADARAEARAALRAEAPEPDRLVVCHGDACAPNTLVGDDGRWTAHVDLGTLGVADRWADLAVATWSTTWNYGPGWEDELLDAYGIAPDPERTSFYRALWDAT